LRHTVTVYGSVRIFSPRMNDRPAFTIAFWLLADTIRASPTTVPSGNWSAFMALRS